MVTLRFFRRFLVWLAVLLAVVALGLYVTGNEHILYGLRKTYFEGNSKPDIDDLSYFDVSTMNPGIPDPWPIEPHAMDRNLNTDQLAYMDSMETCAFLVIRRDTVIFEKYWNGYSENTLSNSFSMAKSFTALLAGVAIKEGYISSMDDPLGKYVPEYRTGADSTLQLRQLLQMSSGIPFGESYASPFGYMAKAYYGKNLADETTKYHVTRAPGSLWVYEGGNSVLLGEAIESATGRTVSDYFAEKVWKRIGAENVAHWNLDHANGLAKTFSGFYATARDFARIGSLYEHDGIWKGDTLVSPDFVRACIHPCGIPDETGEACTWYGLHWWLGEHSGKSFFSCRGMRGQYIICVPDEDLVIVRLGHQQSAERENHMPPDLHFYIDTAESILDGMFP